MIRTGLDRLLASPDRLAGRRYALLAHGAAVGAARDGRLHPAHRALAEGGFPPRVLFGPEHGFYGVEQDMVPAAGTDEPRTDPLTGLPIRSLYGESADSLVPDPEAFRDLDLLIVDLQDIGSRYYTYAATAVWAAEVAREAGCEVWVLDRPNPLGGVTVEGNLPRPGFESFVGAFALPVRHGLTLGELCRLEARRRGWESGIEVIALQGWSRSMRWPDTGRPWIAPSPNMPSFETALVYPGGCLVEATGLSEGRGTTRPFLWVGAPGLDVPGLLEDLAARDLPGVRFLPVWFRPGFQKHRGRECGGIETVVVDPETFRPYRTGVELLAAVRRVSPEVLTWREEPYEFVTDRPALDLLTGGPECRDALEAREWTALDAWCSTWASDERSFREESRACWLYEEKSQ